MTPLEHSPRASSLHRRLNTTHYPPPVHRCTWRRTEPLRVITKPPPLPWRGTEQSSRYHSSSNLPHDQPHFLHPPSLSLLRVLPPTIRARAHIRSVRQLPSRPHNHGPQPLPAPRPLPQHPRPILTARQPKPHPAAAAQQLQQPQQPPLLQQPLRRAQ